MMEIPKKKADGKLFTKEVYGISYLGWRQKSWYYAKQTLY